MASPWTAPVGPLAVHYCAEFIGASLREYTLSAETLSRAVGTYSESFDTDAVWVSADTWVTAQAMGASVAFVSDHQPLAGNGIPRIRNVTDAVSIPAPKADRQGRYPLMVEATRRVRQRVGDDRCVVACFDQYPFSAACALMGIERALTAPLEDATLLRETMRRAADYAVAYGIALSDAGADILSGGDSPAGLLGPTAYEELAAPFEREVIARLKEATGLPVSLHICGDSTCLLPAMVSTGADVLELDHQVDIEKAIAYVRPGGHDLGESRSDGPAAVFHAERRGDRDHSAGTAGSPVRASTVRCQQRLHLGRRDSAGERPVDGGCRGQLLIPSGLTPDPRSLDKLLENQP